MQSANRPRQTSGGARRTRHFRLRRRKSARALCPTWADKSLRNHATRRDRWYGTYQTPRWIVYNSEASRSDAPRDWDDVLDPPLARQGFDTNPNPSDSMRAIFGAISGASIARTTRPWRLRTGCASDANVHEYTADGTLLMQKLRGAKDSSASGICPTFTFFANRRTCPSPMLSTERHARHHGRIAIVRGARMKKRPGASMIRHHDREPIMRRATITAFPCART